MGRYAEMNEALLRRITDRDPALLVVQGGAEGLYYVASPKNPDHLAILGAKGAAIINREQAVAIASELVEIFDQYHGKRGIQFGEEVEQSEFLREWNDRQRAIFG